MTEYDNKMSRLNNNEVIHVATIDEANAACMKLYPIGYTWADSERTSLKRKNYWKENAELTGYNIEKSGGNGLGLAYDNINYYKRIGFKIISYSDWIKRFKECMKMIPNKTVVNKKEIIFHGPTQIIFHGPATIVTWKDGSKTIVKCNSKDTFSKKYGFLMAYFQKTTGLSKRSAAKLLDAIEETEHIQRR